MMKIYEAECEIHGCKIIYKIVKARNEQEAMNKVVRILRGDTDKNNPPSILNLVCLGEV